MEVEPFSLSCRFAAGRSGHGSAMRSLWVGLAGFEPATSASQTPRAAKLRHSPFKQGYSGVRQSVSLDAFAQAVDRSDPVAVCADDLALSDLPSQGISSRVIHEARDFAALRTNVIEIHRLRRKRIPALGTRLSF